MDDQPLEHVPTTLILAAALQEAGAPPEMVQKALDGVYDDYHVNGDVMNINLLAADAAEAGLLSIVERAVNGDFDAQPWESDEWANSPEGRATFAQFPGLKGR